MLETSGERFRVQLMKSALQVGEVPHGLGRERFVPFGQVGHRHVSSLGTEQLLRGYVCRAPDLFHISAQEQAAREREQQDREQPGGDQLGALGAADQAQVAADRGGGDDERQRRRLEEARDGGSPGADKRPVEQRRKAAHDRERQQEDRHHRQVRRVVEQGVEVESQAARHEEDRDEHAEPDRLELEAERRVGHHLVAIGERQDRAGGERAEDHLEAELLGDGGERDQQHDRPAHPDLGGGVLEAQQVVADALRPLRPAHHDEDRGRQREQAADQDERRPGAALAREQDREQDDRPEVGDRPGSHHELAERRRRSRPRP